MDKRSIWEMWGYGFLFWLVGYVLGIILFFFVPTSQIGWYLLPIGTILTAYIVSTQIKSQKILYYLKLGFIWAMIAICSDYLFLVKLLHPAQGYYKLDVYLYYAITFLLPPLVGWSKKIVEKI